MGPSVDRPRLPPGIFRGPPREQCVLAGHPFHRHASSASPVPRAGLVAGVTVTKRTSHLEQSSGPDGGEPSAPCPWLADRPPGLGHLMPCSVCLPSALPPALLPHCRPSLSPGIWGLGLQCPSPLLRRLEQGEGTGASRRIWNLRDRLQLLKTVETHVLFSGCALPPASGTFASAPIPQLRLPPYLWRRS